MSRELRCNRRVFAVGATAALASAAVGRLGSDRALAQDFAAPGAVPETWAELGRLTREAQRLGLSVPRMSLGPESMTSDFETVMPAVVDFIDNLDQGLLDAAPAQAEAGKDVRERASDLLGKILAAEKMPREIIEPGAPLLGAAITAPSYDDIAEGYRKLFATCQIRADKANEVKWYVSKLTDETARARYQAVEDEVCAPWYFVGIIHGLECGFDFNKHLHNGDPLKYRTVQVPKNRPATWNPPSDWQSSAVDALRHDKFADVIDWDLARMLYRWEAYNGWRSRLLHGINTPYLWSFSTHYTKGKYVADNVWDGNAVSKQCGAAVMLKGLVESGAIDTPV